MTTTRHRGQPAAPQHHEPPEHAQALTAEEMRLVECRDRTANWQRWGPYLSERQWGTVREDYSDHGDCWNYFPHDHARSRAYRWGEDGLLGITDRECRLCFALALWNGHDPILKERLFGLTGLEGNHGEDVKECYYYLTARLHMLPTLWFRNTWSWGCTHEGCEVKPRIEADGDDAVLARHATLGTFRLSAYSELDAGHATWLFTENETNTQRLFGISNDSHYAKDAFHDYVVHGHAAAVNGGRRGTKAAAHYVLDIPAAGEVVVWLRLSQVAGKSGHAEHRAWDDFEKVFDRRLPEADEFYHKQTAPSDASDRQVSQFIRQAYAGLLWSKQFYHYVIKNWLEGDPEQHPPPPSRCQGRNHDWPHLFNRDVISMPDKWEYPWFAAWDLAFHMIPMAKVDPEFAKAQLELFLREWYMHPNGQIPAYEFAFSDVNPPVHAWACWRVYKMTGPRGGRDRRFLASVFKKLLINFTWWVNRKDVAGNHLFSGGFLGLDNIGVFDRSKPLPGGGHLEQADGTAWMAFYCATMLSMALELAQNDTTYEDIASKFFEHFIHIADAMNSLGGRGLWNETDGFYYDQLKADGSSVPLSIRSIVGVIPLFAVEVLEEEAIHHLPGFKKRMDWFLKNRPDLARHISYCECDGVADDDQKLHHRLLAIPSRERLVRVLRYVLDENEFLSPFGVRALSRFHKDTPFVFWAGGELHRVDYVPGESNSGLFGGNSNWRGPIWFPVNFLLIEALERYHHFYGDTLQVEFPTGSGRTMNLQQVADQLAARLTRIFLPDDAGRRPCHGDEQRYATDPHWRDLALFYEYFHGDTGRGIGASHQTGWTALVATLRHTQPFIPHRADR